MYRCIVRSNVPRSVGFAARLFSVKIEKRQLKRSGREVAQVSFTGAKKYPILDMEAMEKIKETFQTLSEDRGVCSVFLRSTFAGADLNLMASMKSSAQGNEFVAAIKETCEAVYSFRTPVIAVINGPCLGAGMELVASCDLRIAVKETSTFAMPETLLGIPSIAQASLLPGLIGWGRTRELLYFGGSFDAQQGYDWGFVNALADAGTVDDVITQYEDKIDAVDAKALESQKRIVMAWGAHDAGILGNTVDVNSEFASCIETGQPSRLMSEFLEAKRKKKSATGRP